MLRPAQLYPAPSA
ncbi:hypothetical protein A2U01_0101343, partial [Trifolium medium]|nr:hypothetical protein [Trifolium medium]